LITNDKRQDFFVENDDFRQGLSLWEGDTLVQAPFVGSAEEDSKEEERKTKNLEG